MTSIFLLHLKNSTYAAVSTQTFEVRSRAPRSAGSAGRSTRCLGRARFVVHCTGIKHFLHSSVLTCTLNSCIILVIIPLALKNLIKQSY